ncbi:hypothetical protein RFI_05548 [Reticulomyxa filosa]|uniref:Uncharacterized protein n=1 Tax=Reticulomyxa filosa TaxID=46433 RepID=X6NZ36_RETFI|nr:hypothetical protein RFI_05548 [Reticulomyxa filosa]|eukprot:ETO31570.1 hypothetical protein RFI_05548 [Reticulomyxa filosa]
MTFAENSKKTRRFQNTNFGAERGFSGEDSVPSWKQNVYKDLFSRTKDRRQTLLQRLRETRLSNDISPESKIKNANDCISTSDNDIEMSEEIPKKDAQQQNINQTLPYANNCKFVNKPDTDIEEFRQELGDFMEEMFLKDIREMEYATVWEQNEQCYENEIALLYPEIQDIIVVCPLCKKAHLSIESSSNIKIYCCTLCMAQFSGIESRPGLLYIFLEIFICRYTLMCYIAN